MTDPIRLDMLYAAVRPPSFPTASGRKPPIEADSNQSELRAACKEMEALFLDHLLKEMRATIPKGGLIDGGSAEEIYTSMLDAETAKNISSGRSIGIADMLFQQFLRLKACSPPVGEKS